MLKTLARRQDQVAHRRQLLDCGLTAAALRWRVRSGRWQRPLPGVYALFSGSLTRRQQMIAATLYAGTESRLAGLTALETLGLRYARRDRRIHIVVAPGCRMSSAGFAVITRSRRPDKRALRMGMLTVSSPARATADAARAGPSLREVRAMVAEVVQRELATLDEIAHELAAGPRRGSAHLRAALMEVASGVRSAPEAELRRLMSASRILPEALWNPTLTSANGKRLPTPDGYLPDAAIALEVDSKAHHMSPEDWERTMRRHNILAAHGVLVLHFSPGRIRDEPQSVLAEIERAYLDRAGVAKLSIERVFG